MINVAQSDSIPIPLPRGRFAALAVAIDSAHVTGLTPRLRSLGATCVHRAVSARGGQVPASSGPHDLCVLEASDPQLREELRALHRLGWRRVVVVSPGVQLVRQAIGCGARSAVIPPPRPPGTPAVSTLAAPGGEGVETLTSREVQVLQKVAEGHTNRQIGEDLCLSALTVKSHLARIGRKLGTGDRAEMVAIGFRSGIVT